MLLQAFLHEELSSLGFVRAVSYIGDMAGIQPEYQDLPAKLFSYTLHERS